MSKTPRNETLLHDARQIQRNLRSHPPPRKTTRQAALCSPAPIPGDTRTQSRNFHKTAWQKKSQEKTASENYRKLIIISAECLPNLRNGALSHRFESAWVLPAEQRRRHSIGPAADYEVTFSLEIGSLVLLFLRDGIQVRIVNPSCPHSFGQLHYLLSEEFPFAVRLIEKVLPHEFRIHRMSYHHSVQIVDKDIHITLYKPAVLFVEFRQSLFFAVCLEKGNGFLHERPCFFERVLVYRGYEIDRAKTNANRGQHFLDHGFSFSFSPPLLFVSVMTNGPITQQPHDDLPPPV